MPSFQSPLPEIANDASSRIRYSFNDDWRFYKGDFLDAHAPEAPDQSWRKLRLPHDWAIEGPFDEKYNARCGGLPFHGIAWYRKRFFIPEHLADKIVSIEFDGAMNNSEVWINGHFLGKRPYGYIGFAYDVSRYIKFGEEEENVISVKLSPEDLSSRWYPGAGLYRNSWINFTEAIRVARNGTFVTTDSLEASHAKISLKTEIENSSSVKANIEVETKIYAPDQQLVAHEITPASVLSNEQTTHTQSLVIKSPIHWDINSPNLYKAVTSLIQNGKETDKYETNFGLRAIEFNNADGFLLNGRKVPLQGVCLHHDLGPLGAAFNLRATERQLEIMKEMGVNAIRTSHNPPSVEQLDLCDRMGILVQVEAFDCWEMAKVENGYSKYFKDSHERDLRDMIRRDRNHPSVIMWSIGNEILEQRDGSLGPRIAKRLNEICHEEDPTRPTTAGFNIYPDAIDNGLAAAVDLVGLNYKPTRYKEVLQAHPDWIVYGAETCSVVSSRGAYHLPIEKYQKHESLEVTSYDLVGPAWAYPPDIEFHYLSQLPQILGEFVWTGFDYLGEPTPYGGRDNSTNGYWNQDWPARSSYFGIVDLCGLPKDRYYLYQSQWTDKPIVHLLPHWNWEGKEGETVPVYGYTNCEEAELFLNGKSLGRRVKGIDKTKLLVKFIQYEGESFESPYRLSWNVPYERGELKIVAYKSGKAICEKSIDTAGSAERIALEADRSVIANDAADLSFISVAIEDSIGNLCPAANNDVQFEIEGPGEIAAVGNGQPFSTESFQANHRRAFNGRCMLIIRSKRGLEGEIKVRAQSEGLQSSSITVTSCPS